MIPLPIDRDEYFSYIAITSAPIHAILDFLKPLNNLSKLSHMTVVKSMTSVRGKILVAMSIINTTPRKYVMLNRNLSFVLKWYWWLKVWTNWLVGCIEV